MSFVDVSEVKLPGEAKQNNLPPECGQPIDGVEMVSINTCHLIPKVHVRLCIFLNRILACFHDLFVNIPVSAY
jgi:hypothetical protein